MGLNQHLHHRQQVWGPLRSLPLSYRLWSLLRLEKNSAVPRFAVGPESRRL